MPALVVIATALQVSASPAEAPAESTELTRLEKVWNEVHVHRNADALQGVCADDFVVIVPRMQSLTWTEAVTLARTGRMRFERYETSNLDIRV